MIHPLFYKKSIFFTYLGICLVNIVVQSLFSTYLFETNLRHALIDASIANSLFCLLGIAVWFAIRYTHNSKKNKFNEFFNQLSVGILFILIWNALTSETVHAVLPENEEYLIFFSKATPVRILSGSFMYIILALIYYIIRFYIDQEANHKNELMLKEEIKEAELMILKAQINPHFLFNSLNSLSSLALFEGEKAHEMILKLSDFLRYSISKKKDEITSLSNELENVKRYLDIEKVRFDDKLTYSFNLNTIDASKFKIPQMILQPLYENAVKHGVYETTSSVNIETNIELVHGNIKIIIVNNFDTDSSNKKGAGIGLRNIHDRLKLIYKSETLLQTSKKNGIFTAQLIIPQFTEL